MYALLTTSTATATATVPLTANQVREAFEDMAKGLQSEASLQVLLGLLPESRGGLFVLG
jgi:hypothetical protein